MKHIVRCFFVFYLSIFIFGFWKIGRLCSSWSLNSLPGLFIVAHHLPICSLGTRHCDTDRRYDATTLRRSTALHRLYINLSAIGLAVCHHSHRLRLPGYHLPPLLSTSNILFSLPPCFRSLFCAVAQLPRLNYEAVVFQLFNCPPQTCQTLRTGSLLTFRFPVDCPTYL